MESMSGNTTVRVSEATMRRWKAEKLLRISCRTLDDVLQELFKEMDKDGKKRKIDDIFHL